jgi:toxin ParE1/3/4
MKPMGRFRLSTLARTDLASIHRYIAKDNESAAERLIERLFGEFYLLAENPNIGQARSDLRPHLRTLTHGNYVVLFYPIENGVEVAGVIHGARDLDALFRSGER